MYELSLAAEKRRFTDRDHMSNFIVKLASIGSRMDKFDNVGLKKAVQLKC